MIDGPRTVADYVALLSAFPPNWLVHVVTPAGGGITVEHREIRGRPVIVVCGSNGPRIGEPPLTDDRYRAESQQFLADLRCGDRYTSVHGDHRTYTPAGAQATCYGRHYDRRVIERMVAEGVISADSVDLERVARLEAHV